MRTRRTKRRTRRTRRTKRREEEEEECSCQVFRRHFRTGLGGAVGRGDGQV